jgi:hypothetical protein
MDISAVLGSCQAGTESVVSRGKDSETGQTKQARYANLYFVAKFCHRSRYDFGVYASMICRFQRWNRAEPLNQDGSASFSQALQTMSNHNIIIATLRSASVRALNPIRIGASLLKDL